MHTNTFDLHYKVLYHNAVKATGWRLTVALVALCAVVLVAGVGALYLMTPSRTSVERNLDFWQRRPKGTD